MKFSGIVLGLVAILASACQGGKAANVSFLVADGSYGMAAGGSGGPGDGGVIPGPSHQPPGTTGGNPTLTSRNAETDPSLLSLCMVGGPVLLQGKTAVTIRSSTPLAQAEAFDLVSGDADLVLFYYPEGTYSGLRITYSKGCEAAYSVQMQNSRGNFETSYTVTIEYLGNFTLFGKSGRVQLNIQPILRGLAVVNSNDELLTVFASTQGTVRQ